MTDNRIMEELLQAPTEGYGEAIVIPEINADHFEIKTNLLQLVQASPFHGFERDNPHTHINNFKRITSTLKFRGVPNDVIKLMMFPYSLEGAARIWYDKEPPNSILTWVDLVNKFVNQFFPPSKTTHLKNEISRLTQKFDETFQEAWERFKEMLRAYPHHGFTELTQIYTFYNGLNDNDQDSLNAAMGGNLLSKTTREALNIIENKSKVHYSRNKSNVSRVNTNSRENSSKTDERIDKLADQISTLVEIVTKKVVTPAMVKAVEESCVICGGAHAYYNCPNTDSNQSSVCAETGAYNQVAPPNRVSNQMTPSGFAPVQNNQNRYNQNQGQGNNFNRGNNFHGNQVFQAPINHALNFQNQGFQNQHFQAHNNQVQQGFPNEFLTYVKANESLMRNMQSQINELGGNFSKQEENLKKNLNNDMRSILGSFFQNQASTSGTLPSNTIPNPKGEMKAITTRSGATLAGPSVPPPSPTKEVGRESKTKTDQELTESTNNVPPLVVQPSPNSTKLPPTPIYTPKIPEPNPHQPPIPYPSRLNKEKLQGKDDIKIHNFLQMFKKIHFNISFSEALAHMPKFAKMVKDLLTNKEKLLEIANTPVNENCSAVILKKLPEKLRDTDRFLIPCEFYGLESCMALADLGARINLIPLFVWKTLSLSELSTTRMTLELATRTIVVPEGIAEDVFVRHSDNSIHKIDILDTTCKDHVYDVLNFQKSINTTSGNPTLSPDPMVESLSPSFTPFGDSDFLLEETDAFLSLGDSIPPGINDDTYDSEGDILFLEILLDDDPSPDLPHTPHPDLPSHLEYAFLEGTSKLPVIIAKDLKKEEKEQLLKVLKSHKRAIAWKISDIRGINPNFCTHKILMEDDFKPAV
ncbi:reverse transcriptase domain-containing protein [Tanacetum coccineum]|uniref:Reverse transcriptase domain-containing protein n=1 Tax=Tanacetum coccineum TaxID=301880 RepID=A0ABQ4ZTP4_9ASTR